MNVREHQEWVCKDTGKLYSVDWCIGETVGYSDGSVDVPCHYYEDNPGYQSFLDRNKDINPDDLEFDEDYHYIGALQYFDEDGDEIDVPSKKVWIKNSKSLKDSEFFDRFKLVKEAEWWLEEIGETPPRMEVGQLWEWRQHFDEPFVDMRGMSLAERLNVAVRVYEIYEISRDESWDSLKRSARTVKAKKVVNPIGTTYLDWRILFLWNKTDMMRLIGKL